jgi:hypothetical protein
MCARRDPLLRDGEQPDLYGDDVNHGCRGRIIAILETGMGYVQNDSLAIQAEGGDNLKLQVMRVLSSFYHPRERTGICSKK